VNLRSQTPIIALLAFGAIDLGLMWYGYLQNSAFLTLVGGPRSSRTSSTS